MIPEIVFKPQFGDNLIASMHPWQFTITRERDRGWIFTITNTAEGNCISLCPIPCKDYTITMGKMFAACIAMVMRDVAAATKPVASHRGAAGVVIPFPVQRGSGL